jgi:IclR family mhp operon transcriptional activator
MKRTAPKDANGTELGAAVSTCEHIAVESIKVVTEERHNSVRALQRGLEILAEVNRSGGIRPGEVARNLGLARPTVYRLLETLEELGYVARSASDERFRVTLLAHGLGDGFGGDARLSQTAGPILVELGRRLVWPVDLVICDAGAMVIQETTHSRSPLSIDRGMIGIRLPMLRTAAGRTYLAFCSEQERSALVNHLRRNGDPADRSLLDPVRLAASIDETLSRGYGIRTIGDQPIPNTSATKTSSIGVPIMAGAAILGCITIIWLANALEFDEAVAQFLKPMQEAARTITARLGRSVADPSAWG